MGESSKVRGYNDPSTSLPGTQEKTISVREVILKSAGIAVMVDRNVNYGSPESNFGTIAQYWTIYLRSLGWNIIVKAVDVAAMMSLMKHSRLATSPSNLDHWIDIAGYAACGGECARSRPEQSETNGANVVPNDRRSETR